MTKQFKTERAAEQQKRIEDSLITKMSEKSYHEIPVSEICANASLPRRTFYYYFESKEEVLTAIMDRLLSECDLEAMFFADTRRDSLERGLARFFRYWQVIRNRELSILIQNGMEQNLMAHCLKWVNSEEKWRQLIENYAQEMQMIGSMLGITCVFYTLFHWCSNGFTQSPEQVAAYVTQLLTNPIYETK